MTGKIVKRTRKRGKGTGWLEIIMGNIPSDNVYYVIFEKDDEEKYVFGEGNLVPSTNVKTG